MNIKSLAVLVALSVGSTVAVADTDWTRATANAQIQAEVVHPITVSPPQNANNGMLPRMAINESVGAQLDFVVSATLGYTLDILPTVSEDNGCNELLADDKTGEHGYVELDLVTTGNTVTADDGPFIVPVYYTYTAPGAPKKEAVCMVNLAANYQ